MYNRQRIGEILVQQGATREEDVAQALRVQRDKGGRLGELLIKAEAITYEDLARALSKQLDYPFSNDLDPEEIELPLLANLNLGFARENRVLPIHKDEMGYLVVATDDPLNLEVLDEVRFIVGGELSPLIVPSDKLTDLINSPLSLRTACSVARSTPLIRPSRPRWTTRSRTSRTSSSQPTTMMRRP